MDTFQDVTPLWDFSAANYTQMQDEDFMNLLQKQFPNAGTMVDPMAFGGVYGGVVNPQNVNKRPLPALSPPSEDSSPSPPNSGNNHHDSDDAETPVSTKRKADDTPEDGPNAKAQHTLDNDKRTGASASGNRRKSTGNPKDETRLLKRKEQNRAAQRAFRERKEKHVRDLEDRVAELEAKNDEASSENDNLRDLLARLQSENTALKQQQQQFTFSMPRGSPGQDYGSANVNQFNPNIPPGSSNQFASGSNLGQKSPSPSNPLDWSSLNAFDPTRLNLLEDLPQSTATDGAMQIDFGFGATTGLSSDAPYTSIASNPMFMSFASSFDPSPPATTDNGSSNTNLGGNSPFNFDMSSLTAWPPAQSNGQENLDDLFSSYLPPSNNFGSFIPSPSNSSPVVHTIKPSGPLHITSSTSSPSSSSTDAIFTPREAAATPDSDADGVVHDPATCPRTKGELAKRIAEEGQSPFTANIQKTQDNILGSIITCTGSVSFPKTQRRPENVEALTAWRSITSNPKFKDTDISELCSEFSKKARCDGEKVVLEPSGVHDILETLAKKQY
ncbi:hypothetical protein BKA70DRAFT_1252839 [Coprinopsis sp. MPI-PUGE-AT-0042]|nr:hypothetical protein BKA70DRAFT_1252839 [Coprinopsis sp. MPI-PUGE-AT-0042]